MLAFSLLSYMVALNILSSPAQRIENKPNQFGSLSKKPTNQNIIMNSISNETKTTIDDNDDCTNAEALELGETVSSSNLLATRDLDLPYCGP